MKTRKTMIVMTAVVLAAGPALAGDPFWNYDVTFAHFPFLEKK